MKTVELTTQELVDTNGGFLPLVVLITPKAVAYVAAAVAVGIAGGIAASK